MQSSSRQRPSAAAASRSARSSAWAVGSAGALAFVVPPCEHRAVVAAGDDGTDGDVVVRERGAGLVEREQHERVVGRVASVICVRGSQRNRQGGDDERADAPRREHRDVRHDHAGAGRCSG